MDDLFERLSKMTGLQKLLGALAIYAVVGALLYFPLVRATQNKIAEAEASQADLTIEKEAFQKTARDREKWQKAVDQLNKKLAKAVKELPNDREIPELVRRISTIGKKIGLEFLLFQPLPESKQEFYADVPIKLKVEGSYHDVATFFDRIGKLPRIVNIRNISMHTPIERSGRMILTIEGTAVTYRFLSEEEKAAQGGRRRR
ncbi:MAG: type 4a pilus biogenesis protein PilO [Myxococcota bacterium]|nr:type 4a pilus biogenesis protein PilO [Myxococcota bacterium]